MAEMNELKQENNKGNDTEKGKSVDSPLLVSSGPQSGQSIRGGAQEGNAGTSQMDRPLPEPSSRYVKAAGSSVKVDPDSYGELFVESYSIAQNVAVSEFSAHDRLTYGAEGKAHSEYRAPTTAKRAAEPLTPTVDKVGLRAVKITEELRASIREQSPDLNDAEIEYKVVAALKEFDSKTKKEVVLTPEQEKLLDRYLSGNGPGKIPADLKKLLELTPDSSKVKLMCENYPEIVLRAAFGVNEPVKYKNK